ncbi:MAG: polyphosphate polymerase domain-containing protein [Saprospiraceae bacterium]
MLRYEYKYIIPYARLEELRQRVSALAKKDPHVLASDEYTVRSIYFDSANLECYQLKVAGVKRRNKVRLRGYNRGDGMSKVFFEIKKKVDEPLYKNRAGLPYDLAIQLLRGRPFRPKHGETAIRPADLIDAQKFLYHIFARKLQPVVNVIYEREPYQFKIDPMNDLRITFDKDLRAVRAPGIDELFVDKQPVMAMNGHFIMEVKFNNYLPGWVRQLVVSMNLKKGPASKYTLCMDAIRNASELDYKLSVGRWQMGKLL